VVKDGRLWLAKSNVEWAAEVGLSRRQVDRCMQVLRDKQMIETEVYKFNASPTLHMRYTGSIDPESVLQRKPKDEVLTVPFAPTGAIHSTATCNPFHPQVQSLTCNTTGNTNMISIKRVASSTPVSAKEMLQQFKQGQTETKVGGVLAMKTTWKKLQPEHLGFQKELTAKELGQLKNVHKALGDQALEVMRWALTNWQKFTSEVGAAKGLAQQPVNPHVGYFSAHYDVAVNLMNKSAQSIAKGITAKPMHEPANIMSGVSECVHQVGQADYLDVMAQLEKLTGKP
jgi:hypothetical protein